MSNVYERSNSMTRLRMRDREWAWDEAIKTAKAYAAAMAMVSHRQSKGNLVELVNWLLVRIAAAETREREAVAHARTDAYAEVVAWLHDSARADELRWKGVPGYGVRDWLADRIEELGKKGAK